MSRSIGLKVIAVLLAALSLVLAVGSVASVIYLGSNDLYTKSPAQVEEEYFERASIELADYVASRYAEREYGFIPEQLQDSARFYTSYDYTMLQEGLAFYTLQTEGGLLLDSNYNAETASKDLLKYEHTITPTYPIVVQFDPGSTGTAQDSLTDPTAAHNSSDNKNVLSSTTETTANEFIYFDEYWGENDDYYHIYYYEAPACQVTVYLSPTVFYHYSTDYWWAINAMYELRYFFAIGAVLGVLLFIGSLTYLTWAVGKKKGSEEVLLVGLNKLPLDLYGLSAIFVGFYMVWITAKLLGNSVDGVNINFAFVFLACAVAVGVAILAVLYYCALAVQCKVGDLYWWRNSIVGRALRLLWKGLRLVAKGLVALVSMLPIIWQWLVIAGALVILLIISVLQVDYDGPMMFLCCLTLVTGVILYVGYAFGMLMKGAKRMARGDLARKIPTKYLIGSFRDCANQLNALADVAVVAAKSQLKSERMKTELITNVSHDIKTPLTSIINFVDLLQKPHTEAQEKEYLAVLARHSQQMKKLIEDLIELSKASTGNIHVNITQMDATEAVTQALGEFADKLDAVQLTPVFRQPEGPAPILADGRLVWRVLSNVLSNAVKYALPGTRLYVDVVRLEGRVLISMKNISREQLNVSAEELMERFVRGDASRNTEGSGLGLNIAKSLMDLQRGQLQLLVDGDLFKVTLVFPGI